MAIADFGVREFDGHVVVYLSGELDVAAAAAVAAALEQVAALTSQIIVDLAGLDFIDSSGLAALVRARRYARRAGGDLLLASPQQQVLRVLSITRLAEILSVHAGVEDAARTLRHSASAALPEPHETGRHPKLSAASAPLRQPATADAFQVQREARPMRPTSGLP